MKIKVAELEAVAVKPYQYPEDNLPEIAFAGRSNVGKSSLLNLLTGRKNLARTSGSPGKTRTINFYKVNNNFRIVDLPGYGYAKVSKEMTKDWDKMMDVYFKSRKGLKTVVQLVDIRHKPSELDIKMHDYLKYYGLDGIVVCTKSDKISNNEMAKCKLEIKKTLGLKETDIMIPVSALKKTGHDELLRIMSEIIEE